MARSEDIKTPLARFAFVNDLFEPRANDKGVKKWGCTVLFPKTTNFATLRSAVLEAAEKEWGSKAADWLNNGTIKSPFLDGDGPQGVSKKTGERNAGFADHTFLRVSSGEDYRPKLVDRKVLPITSKDGPLYSGCYGYAVINFWTWEDPKNGKGVSANINMVQVAKDGERLGGGGGVDVDKWAEKIEDEGDAPASTKSGAGAAGLFG
jgi:hypothetical protein